MSAKKKKREKSIRNTLKNLKGQKGLSAQKGRISTGADATAEPIASRQPWFKRHPEWLEEEKQAYVEKGLDLHLDETILAQKQVVVFEGTVSATDGQHALKVIYPSAFPDIAPAVLDLTKQYERHQNPYDRNLCIEGWTSRSTGAEHVMRAVDFFEKMFSNPAEIKNHEIDAPEPASTWYPYTKDASVLIPTTMTGFPAGSQGTFTVRLLNFQPPVIQTVLTDVQVEQGEHKNLSEAGRISRGQALNGHWAKVDGHPPYTLESYDDFKNWLFQQTTLRSRFEREKLQRQRKGASDHCELFGIVYQEESFSKGQYHDQWLIGLHVPGRDVKAILRPSFLGIGDDYFQRMPSLSGLQHKAVTLVGLGALGSRIAIELARAGIHYFSLIDGDLYEAGNAIRQEGNLTLNGLPKVEAMKLLIGDINPKAQVKAHNVRFGSPALKVESVPDSTGGDETSIFSEIVQAHDLVISTVAESPTEHLINDILVELEKPGIFASISNGGWGGQVFRYLPNGACFECFGYHSNDGAAGAVEQDPQEQPLYVRGCGYPTFAAAGFDCTAVANLAVRFAVQTLLRDTPDAYPDAAFNLINWSSRSVTAGDFPTIEKRSLPIHPSCSLHASA